MHIPQAGQWANERTKKGKANRVCVFFKSRSKMCDIFVKVGSRWRIVQVFSEVADRRRAIPVSINEWMNEWMNEMFICSECRYSTKHTW